MLANMLGFGATKSNHFAEFVELNPSPLHMIKYCVAYDMARSTWLACGIYKGIGNI